MLKISLKDNLSLSLHQEVQEICQPFFKKYQLNHLNYIRLYKDNSVFYLCNDQGWLKNYLKQAYPTIGAFEQRPELSKFRYVLWSALEKDDVILKDTREIFNTNHGIAVIEKHKDYCEFYNIGTSNKNQSSINFFINNYDVLTQFCNTFRDKASKLMRLASTQKLILPQPGSIYRTPENELVTDKNNAGNFITKLQSTHLTKTELLCIKLYLADKTTKEIASLLGISTRTVEKHIEHIKLKFNCKNQFQLGYAVAKAGIGIT